MMNAQNFFNLVAKMRHMQKEYFKTRDIAVLQKSKSLEKRVDEEIERVRKIMEREPTLFEP